MEKIPPNQNEPCWKNLFTKKKISQRSSKKINMMSLVMNLMKITQPITGNSVQNKSLTREEK